MRSRPTIIIRPALEDDLAALESAHRASILEIAPAYYPPEVIAWWGQKRGVDGYRRAMREDGETYFIAEEADRPGHVLGFSSHRELDGLHRLQGFYVRGSAARCGVGSKLLTAVEDFARARGARELHVEGTLSGEDFYRARGFAELSRGHHQSGPVSIAVINMVKPL